MKMGGSCIRADEGRVEIVGIRARAGLRELKELPGKMSTDGWFRIPEAVPGSIRGWMFVGVRRILRGRGFPVSKRKQRDAWAWRNS
jgi:hypothetical protein